MALSNIFIYTDDVFRIFRIECNIPFFLLRLLVRLIIQLFYYSDLIVFLLLPVMSYMVIPFVISIILEINPIS